MGDSFKLDVNLSVDAGGAYTRQSVPSGTTDQPQNLGTFVGVASLEGVLSFPTIKKEFDLKLFANLLGGYDTTSGTTLTRSSPLSGPFDRAYYLLSRSNIVGNNFGIRELFLEGKSITTGLTVRAGIAPQELFVYPYHFNSANCAVGDYQWTCSTSRSNPHDNTVWTNPYTNFFGPLFNIKWQPTFFPDLEVSLQTATDWTPPVNPPANSEAFKRWITTPQIAFNREYKIGELPSLTSLAIFYSHDKPASSQNDKGEFVSPTNALGLYALQSIGKGKVGLGYGYTQNTTTSEDLSIKNQVHSINAGLSYALISNRLILQGSFAWIQLSSEERSSLVSNSTSGNEFTVDLSATGALWKGLSGTVGWNGFWADPSQAIVGGVTSRHSAYVFLNYNLALTFGGG